MCYFHSRRRGSAAISAVFWILGIALMVVPFLLPRDVPDWRADDPERKTANFSEDEDADEPLDFPFLEDVRYLEEEYELTGFDTLVREASLERYGRDYRGHFASDPEAYAALFEGEGTWEGVLDPAPIDLEAARKSGLFEIERLVPGQREYLRLCAGCHGLSGDGSGPASRFLDPRPRNFRKGVFKFTSGRWSGRAQREDLFRTITQGLVGSAMPDFRLLPEEKRWDVVEYVRYLSISGEFEQVMVDWAFGDEEAPDPEQVAEVVEGRWRSSKPVYPGSAEPEVTAATIASGKQIFESQEAACSTCHGSGGKGDGPTANDYLDSWGYPLAPRDLTTGQLRVGLDSTALYLVIAHGIKGTSMPGQEGALTDEQMWHLVHFIQSLAGAHDEEK